VVASDSDLRAQVAQLLNPEFGIHPFMVDSLLSEALLLSGATREDALTDLLIGDEPGDVTTTTIESLPFAHPRRC